MRGRWVTVLLALAAISGCTTGQADDESGPGSDTPPTAQAWALDDDTVTEHEYQKAIGDFVACIKAAGYDASTPVLSPIDGLTMLFDLKASGDMNVYNTKMETCNQTHLSHIEPAYVEQRRQVMDTRLRDATARCMTDKGIKLTGREANAGDFAAATHNAMATVMECVRPAAHELFPNLPTEIKVRW